jgi:hypothetical protein
VCSSDLGWIMEGKEPSRSASLLARRDALLAAWVARTLELYPSTSRDFLTREMDPFRNPAGHTLRQGLAGLLDGLLGARGLPDLVNQLEPMVRLLAVQELAPSRALSFLFHLKELVRQEACRLGERAITEAQLLDTAVDQLVLAGFDLYTKCREEICEIEVNAAKRSLYVQLGRQNRGSGG